jgi:hypothetical protein
LTVAIIEQKARDLSRAFLFYCCLSGLVILLDGIDLTRLLQRILSGNID